MGEIAGSSGFVLQLFGGVIAISLSFYFESDIHVNAWIKAVVLGLVLVFLAAVYFFVIRKQSNQTRWEFIVLSCMFLGAGCYLMPIAANAVKEIFPGGDGSGITYDEGTQATADAGISIADWFEFAGNEQQTFLASLKTANWQYRDMSSGDSVGQKYTIFSSSFSGVLDKYIELAQKANDMKRVEEWNDEWGADVVYVRSVDNLSRYLIKYKGTVIDLQIYGTLSEVQMTQISARLHPMKD